MEVGRHAADFLQRMPGPAGGNVVDATRQLVAHGSRQVRSPAVYLLALECATSAGVSIESAMTNAVSERLHSAQPVARPPAVASNLALRAHNALAVIRVHATEPL